MALIPGLYGTELADINRFAMRDKNRELANRVRLGQYNYFVTANG
jgi:hypothetical protein